jgi:transcriptional regulator with XRE-family HTH domain
MQTTKDRLKSFLRHKNISQGRFAEFIGVSKGYVNNMTENPTQETIDKISEKFPELNIDWLIKEKGEMLKNIINQNNIEGDNIQGHDFTVNKSQADKFLDLLKTKDEQLTKSQVQIDRLIGIIENFNK